MQERQAVPSIQYEETNSYEMIKFKKNEDFDFMIDRFLEFQRDVYETYPYLCKKNEELKDKWSEDFMKEHIELFRYMTFQMNYDKENKITGRIALIRQYQNELKVMDKRIDCNDLIKNDDQVNEFCKILRAARDSVSGKKGKK